MEMELKPLSHFISHSSGAPVQKPIVKNPHFTAVETGTSELAGLQYHFCNLRAPGGGGVGSWLKCRFLLSPMLQKSGWGQGAEPGYLQL